jgi:hypothetical protein
VAETVFNLWDAWEAAPLSQTDQPAFFGLGDPAAEEVSLFQIDLSADPRSADEQLQAAEAALGRAGFALEAVPVRLDRLVGQAQAGTLGQASFSLEGEGGLGSAEAELLASLGSLPGGPEVESYGLMDKLSDWKESQQEFLEAFEHLQQLLAHLAWVETRQDGSLLARTIVDWSGDLGTVWKTNLLDAQRELHQRSLAVALASRVALLRLLSTVLKASAKISVLLATPGAQILALPAAWRYVNQILKDFEAYRAIPAPTGG